MMHVSVPNILFHLKIQVPKQKITVKHFRLHPPIRLPSKAEQEIYQRTTLQMIPNSSSFIQPPHGRDLPLSDIESSVQDLVKTFGRRKKLHYLFESNNNNFQAGNLLTRFLESNPVRIITIVLLTLDLICTILELSTSIVSCSNKEKAESRDARIRVFHWVGTAIVCLLVTKSLASAIGLGMAFFKMPGHILDGAVLVLALVLEVGLDESGGGLIVVVSLWRVVRIVEGAFELSEEAIEKKMEMILSQLEDVKEENRTLRNEVIEKDKSIIELQQELNMFLAG